MPNCISWCCWEKKFEIKVCWRLDHYYQVNSRRKSWNFPICCWSSLWKRQYLLWKSTYFSIQVKIELNVLSKITEDLLSLTTKTAISDKKSEAVKDRDYILHKKEFKRILHELSVRFGNPKTDGNIKDIEDEWLIELTADNLKTMNKLLDSNGFNGKNNNICKFWRKLHEIKYPCW